MKIRIQGNSVRMRLSQKEVTKIGLGETVSEVTNFSTGVFRYSVEVHDENTELRADFANSHLRVSINREMARNWSETDLEGLESSQGLKPFVLIEKDYKCLTDRPLEDEKDLFPNPNLTC